MTIVETEIPTITDGELRQIRTCFLQPSPENELLYGTPDTAAIAALAESIRQRGILEPLVVTADYCIVSGHRRHQAAMDAGLRVLPCRILNVRRCDLNRDDYTKLLREHNRQREKTFAEKVNETLADTSPTEAHERLIQHRAEKSKVPGDAMILDDYRRRAAISNAKMPLLNAIIQIINGAAEFWPLSDRQVHYRLLNDPPLIHAGKPKSVYRNDRGSYKACVDLLTRARLTGNIPMQAIADPTRPVSVWDCHRGVESFLRNQLDNFLTGYSRDLTQSQLHHTEIVCEKNTVLGILRPVAARYCIPITSGRGYCSLGPRYELTERFKKSGKDKLILLILSDHDADGMQIASSVARSMRDDFNIGEDSIHAVKVALTPEQVEQFNLPPNMLAKETSTNYAKFVSRHGQYAYELESLTPEQLQGVLIDSINSVIDVNLFNQEVDAEKTDSAQLEARRTALLEMMKECPPGLIPPGRIRP